MRKMNNAMTSLLHRLGVYENMQGYYVIKAVVFVALQEPESLLMVTKWLYPQAAKRCGTNWKALEKNLRTMISRIWINYPESLQALTVVPLRKKPTPSQFVALLASGLCTEILE